MKNYVHKAVIIHLPRLFANSYVRPSSSLLRCDLRLGWLTCFSGWCREMFNLLWWLVERQNLVCSWRVRCRHHYRIKSTLTYFPTILHFTPLHHWRTIQLLLLIIRGWLLSSGSFKKLQLPCLFGLSWPPLLYTSHGWYSSSCWPVMHHGTHPGDIKILSQKNNDICSSLLRLSLPPLLNLLNEEIAVE